MAAKKEIEKHVRHALDEIGTIKPKWYKTYQCWGFRHKLYPIFGEGRTPEEVIEMYMGALYDFIEERLNNNLAPSVDKKTKGHGGKRAGAGRKKDTEKVRVYLPLDIANWIKDPSHQKALQAIINH